MRDAGESNQSLRRRLRSIVLVVLATALVVVADLGRDAVAGMLFLVGDGGVV